MWVSSPYLDLFETSGEVSGSTIQWLAPEMFRQWASAAPVS